MPGQDAALQRPGAARRLAAVAALATVAAAAALCLIGIVLHLAAVVLAFLSLLICATGGWYAVSRLGVVRVIAVAIVVASFAAFGTGLFFAGISVWRVALIVVLGGMSVLAARYALQRTRRQLRAGTAHLVQAGRPADPVLIMNPKSGAARRSGSTSPRNAGSGASSRLSCGPAMTCSSWPRTPSRGEPT